jgi:long-chain-fatty-acid--[acyl-carrier-protein] ligase
MFTNRKVLCFTGRWIFRRRYDVRLEGLEILDKLEKSGHSCLVLPNHPAMVDPMLVAAELWRTPLRPLADESFFHAGIVAPIVLNTLSAVAVPDLRKHRSKAGAGIARGLNDIVLGTLARGGNVIFYPSGHINTEADLEVIGTRQLAYNVCRELPPDVEVIGVRTRGLWGSIWSRAGRNDSPPFVPTLVKSVLLWFFAVPFIRRRKVAMHIENLTSQVKEWTAEDSRIAFNRHLEAWYNA